MMMTAITSPIGNINNAYSLCLEDCTTTWEREKEISRDGDLPGRLYWYRYYIKERNSSNEWELKGTYDTFDIEGTFRR